MARSKSRKAFTLAEILIVIALIILITTITLNGMVNSQKLFIFTNAYEHVMAMVREARSLALTGKAQPDYTDYDNDGCYEKGHQPVAVPPCPADGDFVTPAHYGVYFDMTPDANKVVLFWDVHKLDNNPEGVYVKPDSTKPLGETDVNLEVIDLPKELQLVTSPEENGSGVAIFYSPVFADASFDPALDPVQNQKFFIFGVQETGANARKRCSKIHPLAGIPESTTTEECS